MSRNNRIRIHGIAGGLALLIVATFFSATIIVELVGDVSAIVTVKRLIVYGLALLVPTMAAVGISGTQLAGQSQAPLMQLKRRRMAIVAVNGMLVLAPCAIALFWLASNGMFGLAFYSVQLIELLAGALNITLLTLNARLGLRMSRRRTNARAAAGT